MFFLHINNENENNKEIKIKTCNEKLTDLPYTLRNQYNKRIGMLWNLEFN